jgi:hypothetical protein
VARRHAFVSKRGHDNKSKKKVKNEEKKKKTVTKGGRVDIALS